MDRPKVTVIEADDEIQKQDEANYTPRKLRVAAYARVSTEQDEQQSSYEAQVDYYSRYIKENPAWEFVGIFADEGITGTSTKSREGFKDMINQAMSGKIDLILTKSISRFARNTVDTLQTVRELKSKGVEVIFEKENLHTMDPKCEVMLTIMSSLAQEESRSISENVRWGQQKSMRDGNVHLAYSSFLGYTKGEDGRPAVVEEEAKIIRHIYDLFLKGESINNIARILTAEKTPTPMGREKWHPKTVESILSNEKYKGEALLQKTYTVDYLTKEVRKNNGERRQYLVEKSHEAIIEPEIFDKVQDMLGERSQYRHRFRTNSPFSCRLICEDCGGFFGHKVWHNHANTERYDVWYCNQRYTGDKKCATPTLREDVIKTAFEKVLRKLEYSEPVYREDLWRELVDTVTVTANKKLKFQLANGKKFTIAL